MKNGMDISNQRTESAPKQNSVRVVVTLIMVMSLGLTGMNPGRLAHGGELTYQNYFPIVFVPRIPFPLTSPRPNNHTPCDAYRAGGTFPADHAHDFYSMGLGGTVVGSFGQIVVHELPVRAILNLYQVVGQNCNPPAGQSPSITITLDSSRVLPKITLNDPSPYVWNFSPGCRITYLLEVVPIDALTENPYSIGTSIGYPRVGGCGPLP